MKKTAWGSVPPLKFRYAWWRQVNICQFLCYGSYFQQGSQIKRITNKTKFLIMCFQKRKISTIIVLMPWSVSDLVCFWTVYFDSNYKMIKYWCQLIVLLQFSMCCVLLLLHGIIRNVLIWKAKINLPCCWSSHMLYNNIASWRGFHIQQQPDFSVLHELLSQQTNQSLPFEGKKRYSLTWL